MASTRAAVLTPLYIEKRHSSSPIPPTKTTPYSPQTPSRTSSSGSTGSADSACTFVSGDRRPSSQRNVYTHCGRHTDQYLFGGKGVRDVWRAITKKE